MSLSDDLERLTRIVVRMHVDGGRAALLRQKAGQPASRIAKLAGTTPEAIYAFERGDLDPTTGQALAWLTAAYGAEAGK